MSLFENALSVPVEDISIHLRGFTSAPWSDFLLNPRRLRGSDFLMRWSQGVWSENTIINAVNDTNEFFAIEYGPSGTAPDNDVRAFELYFERLESAGLGNIKRPDLLIFNIDNKPKVEKIIQELGGKSELPFIPEEQLHELLSCSILAVECENSLWKSKAMPGYGKPLTPQKRLGGKPGLTKSTIVPTVIIKEEDRAPLQKWQDNQNIDIHVWHVFFDQAFGLGLNEANCLIDEGLIQPTLQTFQAPGGATSTKAIYKFYYHYAYQLAFSQEEPSFNATFVEDKNGHILPYVAFRGGKFKLSETTLEILRNIK